MDRDRWGLNRSQRMQLKAFVCLLGFLLIVVLLLGKLIFALVHKGDEDEEIPAPHIPVVQSFANVWVMEADGDGLVIFRDGERESYPWGAAGVDEEGREVPFWPDLSAREQVADVVLTDGRVTELRAKREKINGKILGADEGGIEVEGYGRIPLAADYKGYRLYDSLEMCTARDLCFGYSFTDLCVEDGEICGVLMVREEAMEYIRVLIEASDYRGIFHDCPVVTCDVDFAVIYGPYGDRKQESFHAGEELEFGYGSGYFETDRVTVIPDVLTGRVVLKNCSRSQGTPAYRGRLELLRTEDGIVAVNEVLLEEYLYSVVPSEMPSRYPAEALKAQAVCARTYAYGHMEHAGYPRYGAHVDDSTSYQVYNNIVEQESTTTAVKETYGQLLYAGDGSLAGTYYYSTSCGVGSDASIWKTEAAPALTYLRAKPLSRSAMEKETSARGGIGIGGQEGGGGQEDIGRGDNAVQSGDAREDGSTGQAEGVREDGSTAQAGSVREDGSAGQAGNLWEDGGGLGGRLREESAFAEFIATVNEDDFESQEGWYRWTYQVEELDEDRLLEVLKKRYAANSRLVLTWKDGEYVSEDIGELGAVRDIYIEKRGSGGVADELVIEGQKRKVKVISEHNIRYVLNDGNAEVVRQDGSRIASPNLLPSGFFVIETGKEGGNVVKYALTGGGFGHGVGMSQNGARQMAEAGYSAGEILLYFYEGCAIENIYE